MRCGANDLCFERAHEPVVSGLGELEAQYDRYGIYAGRWHEACWNKSGYLDFVFDESYAGESLDEDE